MGMLFYHLGRINLIDLIDNQGERTDLGSSRVMNLMTGGSNMVQMLNQMEANIKREITRLYKLSFGNGPANTIVKIVGNLLYLRFDGALSQIEETLSETKEGKEIIVKIRDEIIYQSTNPYVPVLEKMLKSQVEGISYILTQETSSMYLFVVFKENLENRLLTEAN